MRVILLLSLLLSNIKTSTSLLTASVSLGYYMMMMMSGIKEQQGKEKKKRKKFKWEEITKVMRKVFNQTIKIC